MKIRHLKIFLAVYQEESITRAAEKLYMTQPAVTRAIKELESYYGVLLFERINQRLSVTEAGKQLYDYALHISEAFDRMEKGLRNWDELGVIRVGASVTLGCTILPLVINEFHKRHTGITVKSTIASGASLQRMLENNELDFALIEGGVAAENLVEEAFAEDRLILLLPLDCPLLAKSKVQLADLKDYNLLLPNNESVSRVLINHVFALHDLTVIPSMESVSAHAIVQFVHAGLGISFLPERMVRYSVESGFIASLPVEEEKFFRKNYIVRHKQKFLTKAAKSFIGLCHELAEQETGKKSV